MAVRRIARESQQTEYKSSWQDEYLEWICGYANSRGGKLYVGVNDDGYVVGLADTRFLLDELPNKAASLMGVMLDVDHFAADGRGENIKHAVVPADVARKPANLYARGVLTPEAVADIDAAPDDVSRATPAVTALYDAAPGLVRQLRASEDYRHKLARDLDTWRRANPVHVAPDGSVEYVCITVRPYPNGISLHGRYYLRTGGTNREMTGMALSDFLLERAGRHWDGMPMPGMTAEDLDHAAIDAYRAKAIERGRHTEADVSVSDGQVVSDLKLLDEAPGGDGSLTRAAVLMFPADPERFVVGASVKVAYYAPEGAYGQNKADDIIYQDEVRGPLMTQADRVVELVYTKYLKALTSYEGLQRIETFMAPREAFREIILNAINHKLYESGNPIQISVYEDRIVVFNQGHWPEDIDPDNVYTTKHSSYPHNPSLSRTFFNAGEIEAYGGGFARIRMECDRHDAPYPELAVTPNGVTVVVRACEQYMRLLRYGRYWETYPEFRRRDATLLEDADGEWITDEDGAPILVERTEALDASTLASIDRMTDILSERLTDREKEKIDPLFQYLKSHDVIDVRVAMQLTGKSSSTANRYIGRLVELGVLVQEGQSRSTVYRRA